MLKNFIFFLLVILSLLMVFSTNPINSILFLILIFFNISILFFLFNLDFIGIIFIILYVGAIAVLFLFIVMIMNVKNIEKNNTTYFFIGGLFFILLFLEFVYFILQYFYFGEYNNFLLNFDTFSFFNINLLDELNKVYLIQFFSFFIFVEYISLLLTSCFLILVVLLSSIILTNYKFGFSVRKQYNQYFRNNLLINIYIY
jgi:NADH:ubiquinone oxidoreductase subunit 6 (subunit J)